MANQENEGFPARPYSLTELSRMYGVSVKVIKHWLQDEEFQKKLGEKRGWYYSKAQVEMIFDKLGWPGRKWNLPPRNLDDFFEF